MWRTMVSLGPRLHILAQIHNILEHEIRYQHCSAIRDANYHVVSIAYHEYARYINTCKDDKYLEESVSFDTFQLHILLSDSGEGVYGQVKRCDVRLGSG